MNEYKYVNLPPEIEEIIDDLEKESVRDYKRAMIKGTLNGIFGTLLVVLVILVVILIVR